MESPMTPKEEIEAMIAALPTETIKRIMECAKIINCVCEIYGHEGNVALALIGATRASAT